MEITTLVEHGPTGSSYYVISGKTLVTLGMTSSGHIFGPMHETLRLGQTPHLWASEISERLFLIQTGHCPQRLVNSCLLDLIFKEGNKN